MYPAWRCLAWFAGYRWFAGRTVSRARILFGTSAAPLRDFARQFPPKPAPAAIRAPAPDLTSLTRSNDASPTRENTSFVHAFRTVAQAWLCHGQEVRPRRPFRGATPAWKRAKLIDTSFMFIASCALTFPDRLAVANGRFEVDNEHGEWHKRD